MKRFQGLVCLSAILVRGYGVASGKAPDCLFPGGSIRLQKPAFLGAGLDLSDCYNGTLNLCIAPSTFKLVSPEYTFAKLSWQGGQETFSFSRCILLAGKRVVAGWVYYPHPETKPGHYHDSSIIEVLAPWLEGLSYGHPLELGVKENEVLLSNHC